MASSPCSFVLISVVLTLTLALTAKSQSSQAELIGEVRDQAGAIVSGAQVTVTEITTNRSSHVTSNDSGTYTVTNLKPGTYTLVIEAQGFKRLTRAGLKLSTGERVRADVVLDTGAINENVLITDDASLLRTETGSLGQVITNRKIVDIPLNGRNFLSLVALSPGVAQPPPTSAGPSFPRINGGRPRTNEYLFDGISVLQPEPGQVAFTPVIDAIQEFRVESNSPPAEFGRFNGGVVNLTTRSGSNHLSGDVFEFVRNEALNGTNYFQRNLPEKPKFRRNQFGGVLGGPIQTNRTFFFTD